MIEQVIDQMNTKVKQLQDYIQQDLVDVSEGKHEELLNRNSTKEILLEEIVTLKSSLNDELVKKMQEGVDVNIYRQSVDELEDDLKKLYELNTQLASVVLPIQKMYDEIIEELSQINGGNIFDVKA